MQKPANSGIVYTIDIEASGLDDPTTYPIEIALCRVDTGATWSTLIRPTDDWIRNGLWSEDAEEVHGLTLDVLLRDGHPVEDVVALYEALTAGALVVSDSRYADGAWLRRLFQAVGKEAPALDCFWEEARARADVGFKGQGIPPAPEVEAALAEARRRVPEEHRAAPDAARLAMALRLL